MKKQQAPLRVIENLDDFKRWISYVQAEIIPAWPPSEKKHILKKLECSKNTNTYSESLIQELVTEVSAIHAQCFKDASKEIDYELNKFFKDARDFQGNCEINYGEQAYDVLIKDFEQRLNKWDEIPDTDKVKVMLITNLNNAKRYIKTEDEEQAWAHLYRFNAIILDERNTAYLKQEMKSREQSKKGRKEREPDLNRIFRTLKERKKRDATLEELWYSFRDLLKEESDTFEDVEQSEGTEHKSGNRSTWKTKFFYKNKLRNFTYKKFRKRLSRTENK